jgi:hypothetical protein
MQPLRISGCRGYKRQLSAPIPSKLPRFSLQHWNFASPPRSSRPIFSPANAKELAPSQDLQKAWSLVRERPKWQRCSGVGAVHGSCPFAITGALTELTSHDAFLGDNHPPRAHNEAESHRPTAGLPRLHPSTISAGQMLQNARGPRNRRCGHAIHQVWAVAPWGLHVPLSPAALLRI